MTYTIQEERLTAEAYIDFLRHSDLGSQYPAERFHAAAAAQRLSDILAQGTDISAFGAVNPQSGGVSGKFQASQLMDGNDPGLPLHFLAPSGKVAKLLPVDLQR